MREAKDYRAADMEFSFIPASIDISCEGINNAFPTTVQKGCSHLVFKLPFKTPQTHIHSFTCFWNVKLHYDNKTTLKYIFGWLESENMFASKFSFLDYFCWALVALWKPITFKFINIWPFSYMINTSERITSMRELSTIKEAVEGKNMVLDVVGDMAPNITKRFRAQRSQDCAKVSLGEFRSSTNSNVLQITSDARNVLCSYIMGLEEDSPSRNVTPTLFSMFFYQY